MNNFPSGSPLTVFWHFTKPDGSAFSLNGYTYGLYYLHGLGRTEVKSSMVSASGDTLSIVFPQGLLRPIGAYSLQLQLYQNGRLFTVFNYKDAFLLTSLHSTPLPAENQAEATNIVHLYTAAEFYLLSPVIPTVGDDNYWYVNGQIVTDGSGNYVSAEHTVRYDEDSRRIIIDEGRVDAQGESIEQVITDIDDFLTTAEENEQTRQENEQSRIETEGRMKTVLDSIVVNFLSGTDLYEQAVEQGFEGTKEEWLTSTLGVKGVGIASWEIDQSTADSGTTTHTITFNDVDKPDGPTVVTFNVKNGKGVSSVQQTTTAQESEGVNVITVTLSDGTTATFQVKNGAKGNSGYSGAAEDLEVVNDLDADDPEADAAKALSAYQGNVLNNKVTELGQLLNEGYQFRNVAVLTPTQTVPGNLDQSIFFLANEPGTYTNFGNLVVGVGELAALIYTKRTNLWVKKIIATLPHSYDLSEYSPFATKDAARTYAVSTLGLQFTLGQILKYSLTSGETIIDMALTDAVSGADTTWIDLNSYRNIVKPELDKIQNEIGVNQWDGNVTTLNTGGTYQLTEEGLTITAANNTNLFAVYSTNFNTGAKPYVMKFKAKASVDNVPLRVGAVTSGASGDFSDIVLSTDFVEFAIPLTGEAPVGAYNPGFTIFGDTKVVGSVITIDELVIYQQNTLNGAVVKLQEDVVELEEKTTQNTDYPFTNNIDSVFQSINRKDKYLTKLCLFGDSLLANDIGGAIPVGLDEGNTMRPMRLLTNNVARRLYDWMSWNKPIWRRFDNADWVKSGFASFSPTGMFYGTQESYCRATTSGAYLEITIPQGYEHFALIANKKNGMGILNVTINGNAPSSIQYTNPILLDNPAKTQQDLEELLANNSVVTSATVPLRLPCGADTINLADGGGSIGNPYEIYEFHNLPSGQSNTIRFTAANAAECDVWGGFYWSGNTMVIMDIARGGHTSAQLLQYAPDQLYNVQYDALMWEFPEMNDLRLTLAQSEANFRSMISSLRVKGIDFVFTSCNPLGLSIVHDINFYTEYTNPTQEDINNKIRSVANELRVPFIDLFKYFEWNIKNRGGSLAGGDGGLFYTWDGQHGNPNGVRLWFEALKKVFEKSPITISD